MRAPVEKVDVFGLKKSYQMISKYLMAMVLLFTRKIYIMLSKIQKYHLFVMIYLEFKNVVKWCCRLPYYFKFFPDNTQQIFLGLHYHILDVCWQQLSDIGLKTKPSMNLME